MLKNVQESQNPLFKNSIKMEKQEKTCCFHLFRISKLLKLETRDLHSLKDLFKSFPMVIYFSYFEENEEWFLRALRSASFFLNDLVCLDARYCGEKTIKGSKRWEDTSIEKIQAMNRRK